MKILVGDEHSSAQLIEDVYKGRKSGAQLMCTWRSTNHWLLFSGT